MRAFIQAMLLAFAGVGAPYAAEARIQKFELQIPREGLDAALSEFSRVTGLQVARMSDEGPAVGDVGPLHGEFEAKAALGALLQGTGLEYEFVNDRLVKIYSPRTTSSGADALLSNEARINDEEGKKEETSAAGESGRSFRNRFRMAQEDQGQPSSTASKLETKDNSSGQKERNEPVTLEEIVVSAQKRTERLKDVPVPVTAVSASTLIESNKLRLQDYYSSVPGLDLTLDNRGSPVISIRGITTSFYTTGSTPTVGITIDDVPYEFTGPSTFSPIPDVDPNELARIEVLRGPQGTLYGSSSIGGLVKYVTIDPSTSGINGHVEAGLSAVHHGNKAGYNVNAGVNVPLSDTVAIRASGFTHEDPGYIDNVQTGQHDVNERKVYGGRISALWSPAQNLSLKLGALYQDSRAYGPTQVDVDIPGFGLPPLGDLQQSNLINSGGYNRKIQAYSASFKGRFGAIELTSVTGYNISRSADSFDFTWAFGPSTQMRFGVTGTPFVEDNTAHKLSQEIRLSMPLGQKLDWLFGVFYTHESTQPIGGDVAVDPTTGMQVGRWLDQRSTETYTESAAFTDLTVHVTDRFDIQFGGRESVNRTTNASILTGPYVPFFLASLSPDINPEVGSKDHSFTYLVTPKYTFSPDMMVYARLASGFRPGGPNSAIDSKLGLPLSFAPDTTHNYELGAKGDVLDHLLSFDASVYYIDWRKIQIAIYDRTTSVSYGSNGSRAKSQGEELSIQARPWRGTTLGGWVTWSNAVLTEAFPAAPMASGLPNAASGDRLPYSSRFSAHLSLEQDFSLATDMMGFLVADVSYVGDRKGEFTNAPPRQDLPAYTTTDLRLGARYDTWSGNVYVTNAADRRGLLQGGIGFFPPYAFDIVQPRTVGLTISKKF